MKYLYDLWDDFISLLFPRLCQACGCSLLRNENIICTGCYVSIPRTGYHLQPDNPVAMLFWGRCLIDKAAAFSFYTRGSRLRNLIHKMKYSGMKEIGYELGHIYGLSLRDTGFTDGMDIIIPVPLHPAKKRARGFNQSDYISAGISDATGIPVNITGMERIVLSVTQTNKGRFDRWANVDGIFRVTDPESLEGKHILLIDDVITTGSTLESCAGELLKVKGVKVSIAALGCAVI